MKNFKIAAVGILTVLAIGFGIFYYNNSKVSAVVETSLTKANLQELILK